MTAVTWQETAAAYALNALDPAERTEFEAVLARSEDAQRSVAEFQEVVSLLAYAAPAAEPPASLRTRVLSEAAAVRPIASARRNPNERRGQTGLWTAYIALAASVTLALLLGNRYVDERSVNARLAAVADTLRSTVASRDAIINSLLAPEVQTIRLSANVNAAAARMYVNSATRQVVLATFQLAPAPEGRTYQLWGIAKGAAPVSLGTFNTTANGEGRLVATVPSGLTIDVGAITEEPAGGSAQPTSAPFLVGQVN
jgi:anti-sigma-K factor RskA